MVFSPTISSAPGHPIQVTNLLRLLTMAPLTVITGRCWQLVFFLLWHLLAHAQALEITYPISSTVYPAKGPDKVQWTYDEYCPSESPALKYQTTNTNTVPTHLTS